MNAKLQRYSVIYRVTHKKWTISFRCLYNVYITQVLKISIIYIQYLKHWSKCYSICPPFAAMTKASRFRNCPIAWSIKSVRRKHVYLWHHEWRHKVYLTSSILQRILILYRLRILSLATTMCSKKNHTTTFLMISWTRSVHLQRFLAHILLSV